MQFELLALAATILISALLAVWQMRASTREFSRELSRAVERVVQAIHADIKASQEKLEGELRRRKRRT
jgi:hypothetical protein